MARATRPSETCQNGERIRSLAAKLPRVRHKTALLWQSLERIVPPDPLASGRVRPRPSRSRWVRPRPSRSTRKALAASASGAGPFAALPPIGAWTSGAPDRPQVRHSCFSLTVCGFASGGIPDVGRGSGIPRWSKLSRSCSRLKHDRPKKQRSLGNTSQTFPQRKLSKFQVTTKSRNNGHYP